MPWRRKFPFPAPSPWLSRFNTFSVSRPPPFSQKKKEKGNALVSSMAGGKLPCRLYKNAAIAAWMPQLSRSVSRTRLD